MDLSQLLFPLLIAVLIVPLFLSSRRQKKQMAEAAAFQAALVEGDVVITTSGLRGTVVDAAYEDTVDIEIAEDVVTTWLRAAVREKVDPVPDDAAGLVDEGGVVSVDGGVSLEKGAPAKDESTNGAAHS